MFSHVCRAALVAVLTVSTATLSASQFASALGAVNGTEISDRELESLDAASRRYRVQVYATYRLDRDEFDRRKAAGDAVEARWRAAGRRKDDLRAVVQWLEQATYLSQPEVRQALPTIPEFNASGGSRAEQDFKSDARPSRTERSVPADSHRLGPETIRPQPANGNKQPNVQQRPPPAPKVNGYEIAPPRGSSPPAPVQSVITPPAARQPQPLQHGPAPVAAQPRVGRALLPAPWEVVSPAPSRPATGIGTGQIHRAEIGLPPSPTRVDRPSRLPATVKTPARPAPNVASAEEVRSILAAQSQPGDLPQPLASQLNVGELLARASGYGFGLRTIDSVLLEQTSLDPAELAHLLSELEALVDQRGDLMLYEQLVSADVRERLVRSLDFPQTTVAALGSRIAAARERLTQQSGLAATEREVKLQSLADLSKRLSRLSQN